MKENILFNTYSKAGITIIDGESGCGKTIAALSLIAPELQKGASCYYFSYGDDPGDTGQFLNQLNETFDHFQKHSIENLLQCDISKVTSAYVIIDEIDFLVNRKPFSIKEETHGIIRNLVKRDCRVILVCQYWNEVDLWLDPLVYLKLMGPRPGSQWRGLTGMEPWIENVESLDARQEFLIVDNSKLVDRIKFDDFEIERFSTVLTRTLDESLGELLLVISDVAKSIRMKSPYCPDVDPKKCLGDIFCLANLLSVLSELSRAIQTKNSDLIKTKARFIANYWESNKDLYEYSSDGFFNIQRGITVMLEIARIDSKACANKMEEV